MKSLALIVLMALTTSITSAQTKRGDATVFGFRLGAALSIPECPYHTTRIDAGSETVVENFYVTDSEVAATLGVALSQEPCFGHWDDTAAGRTMGTEQVRIYFPDGRSPAVGGMISAIVIGGTLEGISISTDGYVVQTVDLNLLKAKYGDPSSFSVTRDQNAFSANYKNIHARWHRSGIEVAFDGMVGRTDEGLITITTKKGAEFRATQRKQNSPKGPNL